MQRIIVSDRDIPYTGVELKPLWIYETFGVSGDAIASFTGPCYVETQHLVDAEDRRANDYIRASKMLHFIVEHFDSCLLTTVMRQRLLVCIIKDTLAATGQVPDLSRSGDDIYCGERKMTVSIATISPISTLIHTAINIDPTGAPVAACGIDEFGIAPLGIAQSIVSSYSDEMESATFARCKVRGVQ